jgi:hypothetical protein
MMAALSRHAQKLAAEWEPRQAKAREQRAAEVERGERQDARLAREVEAWLIERRAAAEAEAAMSTEQRNARRLSLLERRSEVPSAPIGRPLGWHAIAETILRRWREEAEQERERELAPLRSEQAAYDAKAQGIDAALDAALGKARRRCAESEQAAQSRAEHERAALGERPALEAVAA